MLVHLEGADKYYGARRVLADVTVTVRKGAKIGVVGPNGGGKSTLLRLLAGMDAPEGGRRDTARDVRIGWLGQLVAFAPEHEARTVESYLRDALQHLDELADRVRELERELARLGGAGVGSGPGFEAGPETGSETGSRTEPDAGSGSRFDTESKTRPEPGSHTVSETGSHTGSHTVSETESEPGSHTEPGTGSHTEPGTRSSARAGTGSSAESGNGSPTGIGSSATSGGNDDGRLARVMEQYAAAVARFEQAGGYEADARLRATAFGLGFEAADFIKPVGTLSGGQKVRLALARLLLSEPDILLLDEPTNHLDTQTTAWLESFLQRIPQAVVVVSHDRWFLDAVTDQTWDVDGGTVAVYPAPYTRAQALKLEALQRQQAEHERQQAEIRRLEQFVERYRAGIKARQARGRAARLARMERTGPPAGAVYDVSAAVEGAGPVRRGSKDARSFSASARPRIGFVDPADGGRIGRIGREALRVRGVTKSFGPNPVFVNINLVAERGQRIGVIGANGSGKTTLLRILAGELKPDAGDVVYGSGVRLGYFAQGQEDLDPNRTIADHLLAEHDLTVEELRRHLARFLFFGDEIDAPVGRLSGGERNRVALARLILRRPNVLLLDEPTNHLDVSARIALEGALAEYDGVIIAVSHDRYFLESVCEDLWIVGDGRVSVFSGMYSQWAENAVRPPVPPVPPVLPVTPGQTPPVHARSESVFPGPGLDTSATNRIDTAAGSDLDGPTGHRFDVGEGPGSDATGGALASGHSSRENGIRGVAPISAPSVRPITAAEHRLRQQEERRRRQQRQRRRRQLASEIARIEKEIEQLEATQQEQESLLADPELYTDEERAKETVLAHRETVDTLSRRLEQWEALFTEAEALDSEMPDTKA